MAEMDFELGNEPVQEDTLKKLAGLVALLERQQSSIDALKERLTEANMALAKTSSQDIPQLLLQHGLSRIKLADGREISIKEDVSVSFIGGDDEALKARSEQAFFKFLRDRGESDIVKLLFAFGRMPDEKIEALEKWLEEQKYEYGARSKVEPQTMKKYWRDMLGVGLEETDRQQGVKMGMLLTLEDIEDGKAGVKIFKLWQTKLGKKKSSAVEERIKARASGKVEDIF
jgi:hypothetical protein